MNKVFRIVVNVPLTYTIDVPEGSSPEEIKETIQSVDLSVAVPKDSKAYIADFIPGTYDIQSMDVADELSNAEIPSVDIGKQADAPIPVTW